MDEPRVSMEARVSMLESEEVVSVIGRWWTAVEESGMLVGTGGGGKGGGGLAMRGGS